MEFWNDIATDNSWKVLIELTKKYDFIVIGGWASYLLTKTIKSKDIDIIADFDTLEKFKMDFRLKKNIHLKKYEFIKDEISVDVYIPYFSKLVIPIEDIMKNTITIEGIKIIKPEILLILKQQAEFERKDSMKGMKDRVDILNLLINSDIKLKQYFVLVKKYKLKKYPKRLKNIIQTSKKEFEYLGIKDPRKIKLIKKDLIDKIRKLSI